MKRIVPCSTRTLIWSFVRERSAPCHSGPTRLGRFLFSARCCSGASTSTHAAHAHRTTWRRFSTSATVRTRSRTRGARVSLGTRPQRRSTETLLDSFSSSSHARPHLTTSPHPSTRSCQGVRGHGGRYRLGPRPRRRCRLEGTPRDLRNPSPDAQSLARGTPQPHPLRRKNIRNTETSRVSPLTFEPSSSRLTRLPAPPPAELALADQARCGGVLRQGQVSGLEGAFCALRKRQSVVGSVSRREDVVGNET